MTRLPLLAAALILGGLAFPQGQDNVLILIADDIGVDYVTCYGEGSNPPPTPNIDALATRGVLFRNAYANPSCSPTRACMNTGRYPFRTYVGRWIRYPNNSEPIGTLRPAEWTLPEVLDAAQSGYAHAAIGKWHLSDVTQGLDVPITRGGWGHFTGTMWGQVPSYYSWPRVQGGVETTSTTYITTQQVDDALAWIGQQTDPWVCYMAFTAPHLPFEVPPAHLHTRNVNSSSSRRDKYKAIIEALDTEIGRLLAGLGSELATTDVVFIGDNGSVQNMAELPFLGNKAKGTPYEGGINVPLIVAGPSVVSGGREVTALACAVDVFTTTLDLTGALAGIPPYVDFDGVSLVPYLRNPAQPALRQFAFAEEFTGDEWPRPNLNGHATVRNDRYKLIYRYSGGAREMFDLQNDPWEASNLLSRPLSTTEQANYTALLNEVSRLRTPRARVATFGGATCQGSAGAPSILAVGTPRLGGSYRIEVRTAAPSSAVVALTGFSEVQWGGLPLPFDLSLVGGGVGCVVHTSGELSTSMTSSPTGTAGFALTVPSQLSLVGRRLFHSWLIVDPTAPGNGLGIVTSDAAAAVLGL